MSRIHSTLIAVLIGVAATFGMYAAVRTAQLGQKAAAPPSIPAHVLAARKEKLAAWRHSLHVTLAKRPPKLPKLPHFAPVAAQPAASPAPVATAQPHVTYVQAPTVVHYKHAPATTTTTSTTSWSDDGSGDDGSGVGGGSGDGVGDSGGGD